LKKHNTTNRLQSQFDSVSLLFVFASTTQEDQWLVEAQSSFPNRGHLRKDKAMFKGIERRIAENGYRASALEELGHGSDVIVITHEANRITIPLLKNGTMDFLIAQDPRALFDAAARAAAGFGNNMSQHVFIDFGIYSRFNIPTFSMADDSGQ
jgi:hypothetical protein